MAYYRFETLETSLLCKLQYFINDINDRLNWLVFDEVSVISQRKWFDISLIEEMFLKCIKVQIWKSPLWFEKGL